MAAGEATSRRGGLALLVAAVILALAIAALQWDETASRIVLSVALVVLLILLGFFMMQPATPHTAVGADVARDLSQDLLAPFLDALSDPAIVLDRDGYVVAFNPAARAVAPGLRRGESASIGLRIPELVDAIARAVKGKSTERVEFSERIPTERWWEAVVTPVASAAERAAVRGRAFPHDLARSLTRYDGSRKCAPISSPMRATNCARRSPRSPASSRRCRARRATTRPRASASSTSWRSQATRMARLIDDLLSLSRIELNAHLRPDKPVDLLSDRPPGGRCAADAGARTATSRSRSRRPPQPLIVPGDRDELIRVFENLVENALKYGASGKRVEIALSRAGTARPGRRRVVAVRDYGPGIAAEHLPRLTERFYRVDVAGSRAQGGTGLGLALVKHILNRHRGRLIVESEAGRGRDLHGAAAVIQRRRLIHSRNSLDLSVTCDCHPNCHLSCHRSETNVAPTRARAGGGPTSDRQQT